MASRHASLERELPLFVGGLLALVVLALAAASYAEVSRAARRAAVERLERVSRDIATLSAQSFQTRVTETRTAAAAPAVLAFLESGGRRERAAALAALQKTLTAATTAPAAAELVDRSGRRVLWTGDSKLLTAAAPLSDSAAVGPLRVLNDTTLYYDVHAPVPGTPAAGRVVVRRQVSSSPQTRRTFSQLIGSDATVLLGNAAGDVWTDLVRTVPGPPSQVLRPPRGAMEFAGEPGGARMGAAAPLPGTPFVLFVEIPQSSYTAPARAYLARIGLIAAVLLALGAGGAWAASRRITGPLRRITEAAEAVATGRPSPQVELARPDELGRLAGSFNTMARRVEQARQGLEAQVAERTRELEAAKQRLEHVVGSSPAVIYGNHVAGTSFSPSWVSENITEMMGYDVPTAMDPAWWLEHLHPDDRERVLGEVPTLLTQGHLSTEYRFRHADGSYRLVRDECRLLRDASGAPVEVFGAWVDITERQRAEQALRASEERFRLLVGNVRDYAIYMLDPTGHVTSWNRGAQQIKGYTAEEIVGRHFSCFYPAEAVAAGAPETALRTAAETGRFEEENWRVRKDGSQFWADVVITAVRDEQGRLLGFAKVTRDLTDRKRMEEALRASEERFRRLAVSANDAIISADHDGVITYFNPGAERIFGYAAEEVHGKPLTVLMPQRFQDAHRAGLARYLATGEAHVVGKTVELAGRRKDGTEFALELSLASWQHGSDVAFTAIIRDITNRKRAEAALEQYAGQLKAANAELESFSYSVSHDLRAPLRAIDGFARMLIEDHAGALDQEAQRLLGVVRGNSQRMGQLIDDLLAFSRLGRKELDLAAVDMRALAQAAAQDLQRDPARAGARITVDSLPPARGDAALLRQVWANLIDNALKFSRTRSEPRVEVGGRRDGGENVYFVTDNGVGFDMRYAGKLFAVFQRLHRVEDFEGTGVGLAIVQRVVHRHGGRVWAEGRPDHGATFSFTLPVTD